MSDTLELGPVEVDYFQRFWNSFPRRVNRRAAEGAYRRALNVAANTHEDVLVAAVAYAASVEGLPANRKRTAVEWLRAEPWRPDALPVTIRPAPRKRRRRDPSKPRRLTVTTRVRPTAAEQRLEWIRSHGLTEAEYEANKHDADWIVLIERRGIVS